MTNIESQAPRLSIVIPVYNVEAYLRECLDSVLAQTFTDWEAILVDDGSTDGSPAICDEYAARDPRFRVIHKENGGLSSARNAALDVARGEFIGAVDSDDWIEPEMFSKMMLHTGEENADVVKCTMKLIYSNRSVLEKFSPQVLSLNRDEALRMACDNKVLTSSMCDKIIRRSLFTRRFAVKKLYEDYRIIVPLLANANRVVLIPDALYNYRMRDNSIAHEKTIDNIRQNVEAEQERLDALLELDIVGLTLQDKLLPYFRTIVKSCKRAMRLDVLDTELREFIGEMHSKASAATLPIMARLGLKNGFRLFMLKHSIGTFIFSANIRKMLAKGKREKNALYHK